MTAAGGGIVRTVLGDVDPASLGPTLPHEHLIVSALVYWNPDEAPAIAGVSVDLSTLSDVRQHAFGVRLNMLLDDVDLAVSELERFSAAGGGTLVEVSSNGVGRDVKALRTIAQRTQVKIVAGCGYYIRASHPPGTDERSESALADEMTREITEGIGETSVRAGVIGELGAGSYPMHPVERRVFRAAARAQAATGAGMIVHPAPGERSALEIAQVLSRAGAQMNKVFMSHLDERFRSKLHLYKRIAAFGCILGFDTFGREIYMAARGRQHPADSERITAVLALHEAGLGGQIGLAQDICLRHELAGYGGHGYHHVLADIVPRMRALGLPQAAIDEMLVAVPRGLLTMPAHPRA